MKKFLSFALVCLLLMPGINVKAESESDLSLESVELSVDVESDSQFIRPFEGTLQTLNTAFGIMDGAKASYTVATGAGSAPAIFNVVNLDTGELIYYEAMEGAVRAWDLVTNNKGDVFIGASGNSAQLWRFDPGKKKLENLGVPIQGMETFFTITTDGNRIYGGGYPTGKAFEYDPDTGEFLDLGIIDVGKREALIEQISYEPYIRSSAVYKDYLYLGSGSKNGRIIKVDLSSGDYEKELIEMPVTEETIEYYFDMQFVYDLQVVDHYLFAFFNGPFAMHVYDLEAEEWLDVKLENVRGLAGASTKYEDHIYFSGRDHKLYRFNLKTLELDETPYHDFDANLRNTEVLELNGKEVMVSIHFNGSYFFMDFKGEKPIITNVESPAIGQSINIQLIHIDDKTQELFASGYMGSELFRKNLENGSSQKLNQGQLEGMVSDGEYIYLGEYPAARIFRYSLDGTSEIEELFRLKDYGQDRPFKMHIEGNKLFVGTIADYGKLQGALSIYDIDSGTLKVYDDLAKDQGIVGIAVMGDYAYLSTTTRGGLGSIPTQKSASIIKFNWKEEKVEAIKTYDEDFSGQSIPMISGLIFDENNNLWAFANGTVFKVSTDDLSIETMKVLDESVNNFGSWRPVYSYIHNGLIYANPGFNISIIHPETLDYEVVGHSSVFSIDKNGDVFYTRGVDINKLKLNVSVEEIFEDIKPEEPDKEKEDNDIERPTPEEPEVEEIKQPNNEKVSSENDYDKSKVGKLNSETDKVLSEKDNLPLAGSFDTRIVAVGLILIGLFTGLYRKNN